VRTLIREIQRHPYRRNILHVDFQELVAGEKVTVNIPVVLVGTPEGVKTGGVLDQIMRDIAILVDPANIPSHIDVDVSAITIGHSIHVGEIQVPEGIEVMEDADATIATVTAPRVHEEVAVVAPEAPAEPELIRKPKGEEEGEE
jgi:large subunit ribosomal protein L25